MNISSIGATSGAAAAADVAGKFSVGLLRKELELQQQQMAQLLAGLGIGGNIDTSA